jgi:hypothetical protein
VAAVDERVPDGAHRMALADARQAKRQDIGGLLEKVALGELVQPAHQRRGQAPFVECRERFAGGQLGGAAQARNAALVSLRRLEIQHLQEQRQAAWCSASTKRDTNSRAAVVSRNPVSRAVI